MRENRRPANHHVKEDSYIQVVLDYYFPGINACDSEGIVFLRSSLLSLVPIDLIKGRLWSI